ncbi:MAG: hypothetical protein H7Z41_08570 [Cytophagales bacterium]|nr:hypothetical protein [Armatimonadota bacterium]
MTLLRLLRKITYPDPRSPWRISRVYWLVLLLIVAWMFLHRIVPYRTAEAVQEGPFLVVLFLAFLNLLFRSLASVQRRRKPREGPLYARLGWFFVIVDLSLIALGLRFTGGVSSPLWVVVFVVVTAETILASKQETGYIRWGAAAALVLGTLPTPPAGRTGQPQDYLPSLLATGYVLDLGTRLTFLSAVTSVIRRLRENAAATDRENAVLRAEVSLADERAKLSREVHDGVGNSLAASVLRLEVAARTLEKRATLPATDGSGDGTATLLREEANALREAMTTVRDWTFFTRPWPAADTMATRSDSRAGDRPSAPPVVPASQVLAAEADRLSRRTGLPITVEGAAALDLLPAPQRLAALRITQEALTNTAKYAREATGATVTLRQEDAARAVVLTISDDGVGFEVTSGGAGVGLASMRERAEGVGGTFAIKSAPGQGTVITACLPVA